MISRPSLCSDYFLQAIVRIERLLIVTRSVTKDDFYDPTLLAGALISITTGLASNALYDLIKQILAKKGHKHIHIEETKKPDGTRMVVVDYNKG